jgi:hypothetical protein
MSLAAGSRTERQWTRLMQSAGEVVQATARISSGEIGLVATRLLQDPAEWVAWEKEFGGVLRKVVAPARRDEQVRALRLANFSWIHKATPFRYLRDQKLRGDRRLRVIQGLHDSNSYARALVAEHHNFVRSTCSLACSAHIGGSILGDEIFIDSMVRYQDVYEEYFRGFCRANFMEDRDSGASDQALLPLLKAQVAELRQAILEYPRTSAWLEMELRQRERSGETQRLPWGDGGILHH